ncbi:hypothetical protein ACLMJV_31400 [Sinorhizobium meliloti]|uniref:hypothetical protein n=1 Tax=Rhizobium meliloti TaxID=382 RepID=UPI00398D443B
MASWISMATRSEAGGRKSSKVSAWAGAIARYWLFGCHGIRKISNGDSCGLSISADDLPKPQSLARFSARPYSISLIDWAADRYHSIVGFDPNCLLADLRQKIPAFLADQTRQVAI